jgi:hypothetical protein
MKIIKREIYQFDNYFDNNEKEKYLVVGGEIKDSDIYINFDERYPNMQFLFINNSGILHLGINKKTIKINET